MFVFFHSCYVAGFSCRLNHFFSFLWDGSGYNNNRIYIILLISLTLFICLMVYPFNNRNKPSYRGKTIDYWLKQYVHGDMESESSNAVKYLAHDSLPYFNDLLRYYAYDYSLVRKINSLVEYAFDIPEQRQLLLAGYEILGADLENTAHPESLSLEAL